MMVIMEIIMMIVMPIMIVTVIDRHYAAGRICQ
jgi:hypothetical protein